MARNAGKIVLRAGVSVVGIGVAVALLLPILFLGDPKAGSDAGARAAIIWLSVCASALIGSLALASILQTLLPEAKGRTCLLAGAGVLVCSIALFVISFVFVRSSGLLMTLPLSLFGVYLGGGLMILAAWRRSSRSAGL